MNLVSTVAVIVTALTTGTLAQRGVTRACSLQIVTDPLLWRHVKDKVVEEEHLEDEEEMERVALGLKGLMYVYIHESSEIKFLLF